MKKKAKLVLWGFFIVIFSTVCVKIVRHKIYESRTEETVKMLLNIKFKEVNFNETKLIDAVRWIRDECQKNDPDSKKVTFWIEGYYVDTSVAYPDEFGDFEKKYQPPQWIPIDEYTGSMGETQITLKFSNGTPAETLRYLTSLSQLRFSVVEHKVVIHSRHGNGELPLSYRIQEWLANAKRRYFSPKQSKKPDDPFANP